MTVRKTFLQKGGITVNLLLPFSSRQQILGRKILISFAVIEGDDSHTGPTFGHQGWLDR